MNKNRSHIYRVNHRDYRVKTVGAKEVAFLIGFALLCYLLSTGHLSTPKLFTIITH